MKLIVKNTLFLFMALLSSFLEAGMDQPDYDEVKAFLKTEGFRLSVADVKLQKALYSFFNFYSDYENKECVVKQFIEKEEENAFYIYDQIKYNLSYHEGINYFFDKLETVEKKEVESIKSSFIELGLPHFEACESTGAKAKKRLKKSRGDNPRPVKRAKTTAKVMKSVEVMKGVYFYRHIVEVMKGMYFYRHIDVEYTLQDKKPEAFPKLFWDLATNIMTPFEAVNPEDEDIGGTSLFQLLCNKKYTEDLFLSKALYIMIKVVESASFKNGLSPCMLDCCLNGYAVGKGLLHKNAIADSSNNVACLFLEDFLDQPNFYKGFDVIDMNCLNKVAKKNKINIFKPPSMHQSLWVVVSEFYLNMQELKKNSEFIPKNYTSLIEVMEYIDIETADFFEACFAAVFYYPSFANERSRQSVEYCIQRAMIEVGLGHINWRQCLREIKMPLFGA